MKKYSIIIPTHNAENWIENALKSVCSQTVSDYELIVVCDACTDRTAEIAEQYGSVVINVDHNRCGLSRNAGLDFASGKWVLFMDDDDKWAHNKVIETIDANLDDNIDILYFGFMFGILGKTIQYPGHEFVAVWNKCWRREFIGRHRFPPVHVAEDEAFHRELMPLGPRKKYIKDVLYLYDYPRVGSLTWRNEHGMF